jgi:hypothetical protein
MNLENAYLSLLKFVLQLLEMMVGPFLFFSLRGVCGDVALIFA